MMTKENEEIIVRPNRGFKALAAGAVATVAGATVSQAALTVRLFKLARRK